MPRFTVDTFVPDMIPVSFSQPIDRDTPDRDLRFESIKFRHAICRESGAGETILDALKDFAEIGWGEEQETLLKTVVWVRDEQGRIVAVGNYWYADGPHADRNHPVLDFMAGDECLRFRRDATENGYTAYLTYP